MLAVNHLYKEHSPKKILKMVIDGKTNISYDAMIKSRSLNSFFDEDSKEELKEEE